MHEVERYLTLAMQDELTTSPQWLAMIDQLYDAVGREQQLAQALDAIRHVLDARSASFFTVPDNRHPETSHIGAAGMSDQVLIEYHALFSAHDAWVNAAVQRTDFGPGAVYRGSELVPQRDLRQTYFFRNFLARHQVTDVLAAVVESSSGAGPASFISFHRHRGSRPFGVAHARMLRTLAPHMRQVLRLHRRLAPQLAIGATLQQIMQRSDRPMIFLGADGTIAGRNPAAAAALAGSHRWLYERAGRLCLAGESGEYPVASVLQKLGADVVTLDLVNDERRCATLELMPVQGAATDPFAEHSAVAIATLSQGARNKALALRQVHGLTAAEARVAVQLAEGRTSAEIAGATGLSIITIRTHIAAAMGKLAVERQAQLVSQVLAL